MSSLHRQLSARSSPSTKSSPRLPGAVVQQRQQPHRALLPSPHFAEPSSVTASSHADHAFVPREAYAETERPGAGAGVADFGSLAVSAPTATATATATATTGQPQPLLHFQPFFTLVEDTVTREHFHPTVHYIFADDDPDIITEAACLSLEQQQQHQQLQPQQLQPQQLQPQQRDGDDVVVESKYLPRPAAGVREHYMVVDVQPVSLDPEATTAATATKTTYEVVQAQSLSSEWQVLKTSITSAPTIGEQEEGGDEGLMLRIEGQGHIPSDGHEHEHEHELEHKSVEDLIARFQKGLEDIRHVLQTGHGGQERGGEDEQG